MGKAGNSLRKTGADYVSTEIPAYQRLKYRPLHGFVNRQLLVPTFDAIEATLLREMAPALPGQFMLQSEVPWMAAVMAKYGVLDLTFGSSSSVLAAADAISWDALRDLGLAESEGKLTEEFEWVEKTLHDDQCFLRVFLTSCLPSEAMKLRDEQAKIEMARGVPPKMASSAALDSLAANIGDRYPLTVTIEDACLTNSPSIWVSVHFYL